MALPFSELLNTPASLSTQFVCSFSIPNSPSLYCAPSRVTSIIIDSAWITHTDNKRSYPRLFPFVRDYVYASTLPLSTARDRRRGYDIIPVGCLARFPLIVLSKTRRCVECRVCCGLGVKIHALCLCKECLDFPYVLDWRVFSASSTLNDGTSRVVTRPTRVQCPGIRLAITAKL